jgi:hypothetical protein
MEGKSTKARCRRTVAAWANRRLSTAKRPMVPTGAPRRDPGRTTDQRWAKGHVESTRAIANIGVGERF